MTNAPFLVTKLKVQVLPCVIAFVNGVGVDRIVGFEGLGPGTDRFTTEDLESRLLQAGVLLRPIMSQDLKLVGHSQPGKSFEEDEDGDEWE